MWGVFELWGEGESLKQLFSQTWICSLEFFHFSASLLKEDRCNQHVQLTSILFFFLRNLTYTQMILAAVVLSKHTGDMRRQLGRSSPNSEKGISRCNLIHLEIHMNLIYIYMYISTLVMKTSAELDPL